MTAPPPTRRSFVYRRTAVTAAATPPSRPNVALMDLSLLPRWGLKGRNTMAWLRQVGAVPPDTNNTATVQRDGSVIARLAPSEVLVLASDAGISGAGAKIEMLPAGGQGACYPAPRADSHCWLRIDGTRAADMFAKLCAVDLAPDQFPDSAIAQTNIAGLSTIVIRHDSGGSPAYDVLCDNSSAEFFWDCLTDAMAEFNWIIREAGLLPRPSNTGDAK